MSKIRNKIIEIITIVIIFYIAIASLVFAIRHPKAGNGAFFVYFYKVITFQVVDDLQIKDE